MFKRKRARSSIIKTVETVVNSLVARVVKDEDACTSTKSSSEKLSKTFEVSNSNKNSQNVKPSSSKEKIDKHCLKKDVTDLCTEKKSEKFKTPKQQSISKKVTCKSSLVKQKTTSTNACKLSFAFH